MNKNLIEELNLKIENKQKEMTSLNLTFSTEKEILTNEIKNLNKIIQNLNATKNDNESLLNHETELNNKNNIIKQNEKQLKSLGLQLLKKEELITELLSDRNSYKIRLNDMQQRYNILEKQLKLIMNNENISPYSSSLSQFSSSSSLSSSSNNNGNNNNSNSDLSKNFDEELSRNYNEELNEKYMIEKLQKQINNNKIITEFEKFGLNNNSKMSQFLNFIDVSTYSVGRYLKTNPLLRLLFIVYFIILHIYILIFMIVHLYLFDIEE